jgi:hypothetical protein
MRWFQSDGRSAVPTERSLSMPRPSSTLYGLNVSTRPGPCGGRRSNQAFSFARARMPSRVRGIAKKWYTNRSKKPKFGLTFLIAVISVEAVKRGSEAHAVRKRA